MIDLSPPATERLQAQGIDLDLVAGLINADALQQVNEQAFSFAATRVDGSQSVYFWAVGADPQPYGDPDDRPAAWWPVGSDGSTAIVLIGAENGLALASVLFHVADDGLIRRRPNLPGVLASAVPVVLPESHTEIPVEWMLDDEAPAELISALASEGCRFAFLVLVVETPAGLPYAEILPRTFIKDCASAGKAAGITVAPLPLPNGVGLGRAFLDFHGHGRNYALAGVLEFARLIALHPPTELAE